MGRPVRRIAVSSLLTAGLIAVLVAGPARSASASTPVNEALHGGPVVSGAINIHVIFRESHAVDSSYDAYILNFLNDLNGSSLMSTLAPYTGPGIDPSSTGAPGPSVTVGGVFHDTVNPLPTCGDNSRAVHQAVVTELNTVSTSQNWPDSAGNVFLILTGPGYQANSTVCGWHAGGTDSSNGNQVPYAFIPRPSLTLKTYCDTGGYNPTPSGSVRHDSGVNTTWHELAEMLTDPMPLTGYNDPSQPAPPGGEIGDVCDGQFPGVTGSNNHDVVLNGRPYLVQGVWSPTAQSCVVHPAGNFGHLGSKRNVLIYGDGEPGEDPSYTIFSNLAGALSAEGLYVTTFPSQQALPADISGYGQIWLIGIAQMSAADEQTLESLVQAGGSVYLTGEWGSYTNFNNQGVADVLDNLVGPQITITGENEGARPLPINANVTDHLSTAPNSLTSWSPANAGGLGGVAPSNVLSTDTYGNASGAGWAVGTAGGRLAVLMDINWAESPYEDSTTMPRLAENLGFFLSS